MRGIAAGRWSVPEWVWAVFAAVAALPAQQFDVALADEAVLAIEHSGHGQPSAARIPIGVLPYGSVRSEAAASGATTGLLRLRAREEFGAPFFAAEFEVDLPTVASRGGASAISRGDFLLRWSAPAPVAGAVSITLDVVGSSGPGLLGELFVDLGADGTFEYSIAGPCGCVQTREFPFAIGPNGGLMRILHVGSTRSTTAQAANYRARVQLAFLRDTSPAVPWRRGCAGLQWVRWTVGAATVGFDRLPGPGRLLVLGVGLPGSAPPPLPGAVCLPHMDVAVTRVVTAQNWMLAPPPLPPGVQVVLQGFVFEGGVVLPTDSWLYG